MFLRLWRLLALGQANRRIHTAKRLCIKKYLTFLGPFLILNTWRQSNPFAGLPAIPSCCSPTPSTIFATSARPWSAPDRSPRFPAGVES